MRDLDVTCTKAQEFSTNVALVASKAHRTSSALLRSFRFRNNKVLWTAFTAYVLPMLNYASVSWKPYLRRDVNLLENVQRRYTKRMCRLFHGLIPRFWRTKTGNQSSECGAYGNGHTQSFCHVSLRYLWNVHVTWLIYCMLQNHSRLGRLVYVRSRNFSSKKV